MKAIILSLFVGLFMVGCWEDAVDYSKLQDRVGVMYLPNEDTPFTVGAEDFYENGQIHVKENYKDGKLEGSASMLHEDGQKHVEGNWKDGKEDGLWTFWYENGKIESRFTYKDGK